MGPILYNTVRETFWKRWYLNRDLDAVAEQKFVKSWGMRFFKIILLLDRKYSKRWRGLDECGASGDEKGLDLNSVLKVALEVDCAHEKKRAIRGNCLFHFVLVWLGLGWVLGICWYHLSEMRKNRRGVFLFVLFGVGWVWEWEVKKNLLVYILDLRHLLDTWVDMLYVWGWSLAYKFGNHRTVDGV